MVLTLKEYYSQYDIPTLLSKQNILKESYQVYKTQFAKGLIGSSDLHRADTFFNQNISVITSILKRRTKKSNGGS